MNFLKRGIANITRKPGKTFILLLIVFILGNIICGAISIRQAVENTENNLRSQMRPVATLAVDEEEWEKREANGEIISSIAPLSLDVIKKVGELPYVDTYDYIYYIYLSGRGLTPYREEGAEVFQNDFQFYTCIGGQDPEIIDIKENIINLVSGRTFAQDEIDGLEYVAVISQNLAYLNNLSVGSTFNLENIIVNENFRGDYGSLTDEEIASVQTYEFEVIGIFEQVNDIIQNQEGAISLNQEMQNTIYITNNVAINIDLLLNTENSKEHDDYDGSEDLYYNSTFVLKDSADMDKFTEEASKLLPDLYTVQYSDDYSGVVEGTMESITQFAQIILYVAVAASLIILSLLITLFMKDRKHEIGIYLSLGEQKIKIIAQIVLEVVVVAAIAITLSLFTGNMLASKLSETMLTDQIAEQQKLDDGSISYNSLQTRGYGSNISVEELVENYSITLSSTITLLFFAVGLGTVIISTLVPIIYITRLNPKKIMM